MNNKWRRGKLTGPVSLAFALGVALALSACGQPPPKTVYITRPSTPAPPDPALLHKAFEDGYAAGYAMGKKAQERLGEQLRGSGQDASCAALLDNSAMQTAPAPTALPSAPVMVPQTTFQPAGQAVPLSGR